MNKRKIQNIAATRMQIQVIRCIDAVHSLEDSMASAIVVLDVVLVTLSLKMYMKITKITLKVSFKTRNKRRTKYRNVLE